MMKRRRNNNIIEQNIDNKKKLSLTRFEDLSNELIYDIFDYSDYFSTYDIFSNLNLRFQSLFFQSSLPLHINIPLTSKSIFQYRCKHIITPNIKRIISLNISKYLLEYFPINFFSSLESLTFSQIQSDQISAILTDLISLPRFSFLSIHSSDYFQDENSIYLSIFRLIKLKVCKLAFPSGGERVPLPISINQYQILERLIINGRCRLDQLISILSYLPVLQQLSCQHLYGTGHTEIKVPMSLTSVCLTLYRISFSELKLFLSKISLRLKKLSIRKSNDDNYFHAGQWQQLILNYMPCLCMFDLQYSVLIEDDSHQILIDRFSSDFWIERQWLFDHYYSYKNENSSYLNFFSIVPYRNNHFTLYESINDDQPKSYRNSDINFARHLTIEGRLRTSKYSIQFPRVTKLTLKDNNIEEHSSFINHMTCIVPLLQITELRIKDNEFSFNELIQILCVLPNLQSLTLPNIRSKRTETTDLLSRNIRITKVIIDDDDDCQCEDVHFLIDLFPHLEYLEISIDENHLEDILRFLLSKTKYLFSLFLLNVNYEITEKVQTLIKNEKLLSDYTIEQIHGGLYLWW